MLRNAHSIMGLVAALLLMLLAISGATLSLNPSIERFSTKVPAQHQMNVATLAGQIVQHYPGVEQIQRSASGSIVVYYSANDQSGAVRVDPISGQGIGAYTPSSFMRWMKNLHRSFLLGTPGRAVAGFSALSMLILCLSGVLLLIKRQGGWRELADPVRGNANQRWHAKVGRIAAVGLLLSALTGIFLSAVTFELVSDGKQEEPDFPTQLTSGPTIPVDQLSALLAVDINDLRELVFPMPGNPEDFYSLRTTLGDGYVDQATGELLSYRAHSNTRRIYDFIYQLHTGEGLWWLGLILGLSALSVPLMGVTGIILWWQRRRLIPKLEGNSAAQTADAIILVGSENNGTWGFAKALHDALRHADLKVHTAPMNKLAKQYSTSQYLFILTATYGDGDPPSSATQFTGLLNKYSGSHKPAFAVLGFGDRQFAKFCQFAKDTQDALLQHGWQPLLDLETVDRQSPQEFNRWGERVGSLLNRELTLTYNPIVPATRTLELISKVDYGEGVQAPTSVLRFGPVAPTGFLDRFLRRLGCNGLPHFEAGDLAGVVPSSSPIPRFYSLASSAKDGFLEICVRKQPGGLCSQMLCDLTPGERAQVFIKPNPDFRPASGQSSIILVGAGAGIGPLAGFIRNNTAKHPMYLYWGGRDPDSDFLYKPELDQYLADGRLTQLNAAFSRVQQGAYVQDKVLDNAAQILELVKGDGQILVCGSRAMAASIRQALDDILAPARLDVQTLKLQGRYREDVF